MIFIHNASPWNLSRSFSLSPPLIPTESTISVTSPTGWEDLRKEVGGANLGLPTFALLSSTLWIRMPWDARGLLANWFDFSTSLFLASFARCSSFALGPLEVRVFQGLLPPLFSLLTSSHPLLDFLLYPYSQCHPHQVFYWTFSLSDMMSQLRTCCCT